MDLLSPGMYGCIHVMKTRPKPLNMLEELFVAELRCGITYYIARGAQERAKQALRSAKTADNRMSALTAFLKACIPENNLLEAIALTEDLLKDPQMIFHRSRLLFHLGVLSERLYEFDAAISYYCRSLACGSRPEELHDVLWSNLGFCWLYKQDFKTAEQCCRWAISINGQSWDAWKNLGVSLEHQQHIEEAFLAYFKGGMLKLVETR